MVLFIKEKLVECTKSEHLIGFGIFTSLKMKVELQDDSRRGTYT